MASTKRFLKPLLSYALALYLLSSPAMAESDFLTADERLWLQQHPKIRMAPAPNYPPIEFFDEQGVFQGISAAYIKLFEKKLGIDFEVSKYDNWSEAVKATKKREADMWGCIVKTDERSKYMNFSSVYIRLPATIIVRKEWQDSLTMQALAGKRVVVMKNYATEQYIQDNYPQLELLAVPDIKTGLQMVSFGIADAIVVTDAVALYYIEQNGISNLRVAGDSGYEWQLRFAVRNDWPELINIIQKTLDSIPESQRREIYRSKINLEYQSWQPSRNLLVVLTIGVTGILVISILIWNRTLRHKVNRHTSALKQELLEREKLEQELRHLANTDPLTGILNRRKIVGFAQEEFDRARRYQGIFSIILLDIDHFKVINDTYGHSAGDIALKTIANACQESLRDIDQLGRLGGEEFLVLLPETGLEQAVLIAERVRAHIESLEIYLNEKRSIKLTVSLGVTCFSEEAGNIGKLIHSCDQAMYRAKKQGRNCVIVHSPEPTQKVKGALT